MNFDSPSIGYSGETMPPLIFQVRLASSIHWCYEQGFARLADDDVRRVTGVLIKLFERKQNHYPINQKKSPDLGSRLENPTCLPRHLRNRTLEELSRKDGVEVLYIFLCNSHLQRPDHVQRLREALEPLQDQICPQGRLEVLDEVFNARTLEEQYLSGHISGDSLVSFSHIRPKKDDDHSKRISHVHTENPRTTPPIKPPSLPSQSRKRETPAPVDNTDLWPNKVAKRQSSSYVSISPHPDGPRADLTCGFGIEWQVYSAHGQALGVQTVTSVALLNNKLVRYKEPLPPVLRDPFVVQAILREPVIGRLWLMNITNPDQPATGKSSSTCYLAFSIRMATSDIFHPPVLSPTHYWGKITAVIAEIETQRQQNDN